MIVYLVEIEVIVYCNEKENHRRFDPIAIIASNIKMALNLLKKRNGLITKMEIDVEYSTGIGKCEHWHIKEGVPDRPIE